MSYVVFRAVLFALTTARGIHSAHETRNPRNRDSLIAPDVLTNTDVMAIPFSLTRGRDGYPKHPSRARWMERGREGERDLRGGGMI